MNSIRILYIVTHPITACNLMRGQLAYMKDKGFDVLLISSPGRELEIVSKRENVQVLSIPMRREIHLLGDLIAFFRLYRAIVKFQPHIVNAGTPKAGLLGMLAAAAGRVPVRIYTLRGLRLETTRGWMRKILSATERIASACSHQIVCVSESLRKLYVNLGLASSNKTVVLARGSSNGVDSLRFQPDPFERDRIAKELNIHLEAPVLGFVGRLVNDKGVMNLLDAFESLLVDFPTLQLLLIGGDDATDRLSNRISERIAAHPNIIAAGAVEDAAPYYALFDLLIFPSFREGFPNAPMEAAATGVPTVGFRTTGTVDAVEDGITGTLVPAGDSQALAQAIRIYLENEEIRVAHGRAAKERVMRSFQPQTIWEAMYENYRRLLAPKLNLDKVAV